MIPSSIFEHEINFIWITFDKGIVSSSHPYIKKTAETLELIVVSFYIKVNLAVGECELVVTTFNVNKELAINNMNHISISCNV